MKIPKPVEYWDDERNIGNSLIVTLKKGLCFEEVGEHVRGFDTVLEAKTAVKEAKFCNCPYCTK